MIVLLVLAFLFFFSIKAEQHIMVLWFAASPRDCNLSLWEKEAERNNSSQPCTKSIKTHFTCNSEAIALSMNHLVRFFAAAAFWCLWRRRSSSWWVLLFVADASLGCGEESRIRGMNARFLSKCEKDVPYDDEVHRQNGQQSAPESQGAGGELLASRYKFVVEGV